MCENQTSWENREQQVTFGRMIGELLRLKFGRILNADCQGGGEIANLVITGHNIGAKKMEEMRDFLIDSYELNLHKIKNHGHTAGTIVVHISEITNTSRKIIEDDFHLKIIIPKSIENKKSNSIKTVTFSGSRTKKRNTVFVNKEIVKNQNSKKMEEVSVVQRGRRALSVFMTMMFKFEGIISGKKDKIFNFDEKKTDDCQVISFRNEADAEVAHKALVWYFSIWYFSNAKEMPILGNKEIMVDFSTLSFEKTRPANVSFCLPPLKGETSERIKVRSMHLFTGYKPSSVYVIDEDTFSIGYSKLVTTQKFFELVSEMGWGPVWQDDLIICKFRPKPEIAPDEVPEANAIELDKSTPASEPDKKVLDLGPSFVSPRSVSETTKEFEKISAKNLFTQTEAIEQFKKMFNDQNIWSKISHERKVKIFNLLKEDTKKTLSNEDFAKYLLGPSNKFFTKGEVVSELQIIFRNPNFLNFSESVAGQVRSILKEELIDLDPDDLAGDLLDLF